MAWGQSALAGVYRNRGLLESAAARPFQTAFGEEIHQVLFAKGATLFHSLITNHPFGDGNKRTAVLSLQLFLVANDVLLLATPSEMYDLAINTASAGERAVPQEELLGTIETTCRDSTVMLREIRGIKAYHQLYTQASRAKRHVRNNAFNKQP